MTSTATKPLDKLAECERQHHFVDWVDCWNGCDEGWITDLYDMDPLWYDPGDMEACDICHGKGGWRVCRTCHPEVGDDD